MAAIVSARTIEVPVKASATVPPLLRFEPVYPKLTLALSGGGARGFAHLGVIQSLEANGLQPSGIAGTSVGALIGALYTGGLNSSEIIPLLRRIDWNSVMLDEPERRSLILARKEEHTRHLLTVRLGRGLTPVVPGAIAPGQKLYLQLLRLTLELPYRSNAVWDSLDTPLRITATDIISGEKIVFNRGDPTLAIRASMALPLLFDPVKIDSLQLIDGGISENIPVESAHSMGGDVILAVNVSSPLRKPDTPWQPWQIVDQVTTILERHSNVASLDSASIVVTPNLLDAPSMPSQQFDSLALSGWRATEEIIDSLKQMLIPPKLPDDDDEIVVTRIQSPDPDLPQPLTEWRMKISISLREIRDYLRRLYQDGTISRAAADFNEETHTLSFTTERTPLLTGVSFKGAKLLPDSVLADAFAGQIGSRLDFNRCQSSYRTILKALREAGYCASDIESIWFDSESGILTITINPGVMREIEFVGLERVSRLWLEQEVPLKVGKPITREGILEGATNLYATGLFRSVYPVLVPPDRVGQGWKVEIHVNEQPAPLVRLGLVYQHEHRTRGFAEVTYPSAFNYGARGVILTSVGERDQMHQIEMANDKLFGRPVAFSLTGALNRRSRSLYDMEHIKVGDYTESQWGGKFSISGQAWSWGQLALYGKWEQHDGHYPNGAERYRTISNGGELALDTEDRYPYPNRGVKLTASAEAATGYLGSQREFSRLVGLWESYFTPVRRQTFAARFSMAAASGDAPRDQQIRLGGMHSFPGLHLDEIITTRLLTAGLEYRYDMLSRLIADSYIGARWDYAAVWRTPGNPPKAEEWLQSFALYFALDTVLGPIHLQWGYLPGNNWLLKQNVFSIQAGNSF